MAKAPILSTVIIREYGKSSPPQTAINIPPSWQVDEGGNGVSRPEWTVLPVIEGNPVLESAIFVNEGSIINGTVTNYQWLRNGLIIPSAILRNYIIVSEDVGKTLTVRLTATGPGGQSTIITTGVIPITNPLSNSTSPYPKPYDPALAWSSDFSAYPNGTPLSSLTGWNNTVLTGDGNSGSATSTIINNGKLTATVVPQVATWSGGRLTVRDLGVKVQTIRVDGAYMDVPNDGTINGCLPIALGVNPTTGAFIVVNAVPKYRYAIMNIKNSAGEWVVRNEVLGTTIGIFDGGGGVYDYVFALEDQDEDGIADTLSYSVIGIAGSKRTFTLPAGLAAQLGTYAGVSTAFNSSSSINSLQLAGAAVYPDLTIQTIGLNNEKKISAVIKYYSNTSDKYEMQVSVGSNVILNYHECNITANNIAGTATIVSPNVIGNQYRGVDIKVNIRKVSTNIMVEKTFFYNQPISYGQNAGSFGGIQSSDGGTRQVYTNLAISSHWQDPTDSWHTVYYNDPVTAYNTTAEDAANRVIYNGPARISAKGSPLKSGMNLTFMGPDPRPDGQSVTLEMTWTGGAEVTLTGLRSAHDILNASLATLNPTPPKGINKLEFRCTPTMLLDPPDNNGNYYSGIAIAAYVNYTGVNPPDNISIHIKGSDLSKRFTQSYLDMMTSLPGPIRHMQGLCSNQTDDIVRHTLNWNLRSRQNGIAISSHPLGIPLEDAVEISYRSNRPLWWNLPASSPYSTVGKDYIRRAADLIWNGVDSDISFKLSDQSHQLIAELGNELWNVNWPFYQAYSYIIKQGIAAGRYPTTFVDRGVTYQMIDILWPASIPERLWATREIMQVIAEKVPLANLDRVLGLQHANASGQWSSLRDSSYGGQLSNLPEQAKFNNLDGIDTLAYAHYIGGDHNSGSGQALPTGNSPAIVRDWIIDSWEVSKQLTIEWNGYAKTIGKKVAQYEFGFNLGLVYMTREEELVLRASDEYTEALNYVFDDMARVTGGWVAVYTDMGGVYTGGPRMVDGVRVGSPIDRWAQYVIPNHPTANRAWETMVAWQAANPPE